MLLRLAESRGPKPPPGEGRTASFVAILYPKQPRLRPLELRASSVVLGISVLGESDALAARGRRAEDEWAVLLRFFEPPGLRAGPFGPPGERAART